MATDSASVQVTASGFSVERWLRAFGLSEHAAAFHAHGLVNYERCINLSEEDIRAVGVNNVPGLMNRVKELRRLSEEDTAKLLSSPNMSLYLACRDGDVKLAQQLITNGANVNWRNPLNAEATPMYVAARHGDVDLLNMLIDAGGDVNIANVDKQTPVWSAAFNGHVGALKALIRAKADVNAADVNKFTPVFVAAANGHAGVLSALISTGADFNAANVNKATPVFIAAQQGHIEALSVLISAGADFNAAMENQDTPAHIAAYKGHVDILRTLHQHGANLNTKNKWDKSPLDWAVQANHSSIVEFFKAIEKNKIANDVFTKHYDKLMIAIEEPLVLAAKLRSKGYIGSSLVRYMQSAKGISDDEKSIKLLNNLESFLRVHDNAYGELEKLMFTMEEEGGALKVVINSMRTMLKEAVQE